MKTNLRLSLTWLIAGILFLSSAVLLTNCKGHVEIFGVIDSVENCSPPYVVYFKADADHRTKKLEYSWTFGDGNSSNDQEAVHIYQEEGVYQVNLRIKQNKVEDNYSYTLYLTDDSTVVFSDWDYATLADSLWVPAYVEFQNYSEFATNFLWEFGDGDISNAKHPTHVYESQGTYSTVLNAICTDDTSRFSREMVIKPPPNKLDIFDVTVWMPNSYLGTDVWVNIWYNGFLEDESSTATSVTSFPVSFTMTHTLFHFNGDFNSDLLEFELWSSINDGNPEKIFSIESRSLQLEYYPSLISRDDGYGYAFEAIMGYRD